MGNFIWADLENEIKDPRLSTLWRIAEALDINPRILIQEVEKLLGDDFSFLENIPAKKKM